ncbi:MAG: hypothetical protein ABIK28_00280, partial [Planctomycetota bacterium]
EHFDFSRNERTSMSEELKVISDFYDFMLWLIRHVEKFPRHHRYSLGLSMENRLQCSLRLSGIRNFVVRYHLQNRNPSNAR